jgi:hypothetical protein
MENQRNAYEKRLYVQIQEWSVDIALLSVKASMARRIVNGIALMALPYFIRRPRETLKWHFAGIFLFRKPSP